MSPIRRILMGGGLFVAAALTLPVGAGADSSSGSGGGECTFAKPRTPTENGVRYWNSLTPDQRARIRKYNEKKRAECGICPTYTPKPEAKPATYEKKPPPEKPKPVVAEKKPVKYDGNDKEGVAKPYKSEPGPKPYKVDPGESRPFVNDATPSAGPQGYQNSTVAAPPAESPEEQATIVLEPYDPKASDASQFPQVSGITIKDFDAPDQITEGEDLVVLLLTEEHGIGDPVIESIGESHEGTTLRVGPLLVRRRQGSGVSQRIKAYAEHAVKNLPAGVYTLVVNLGAAGDKSKTIVVKANPGSQDY